MEKYEKAICLFAHGVNTYALTSTSGKTIETLWTYDTQTGHQTETKLRTLGKISASKLPEVREDFAWFSTASSMLYAAEKTEGN